jgi:hypothetical protein
MSAYLNRLAQRVMRDRFFLAAPLARFAESHQMHDIALARHFRCDVDTLSKLRLCRNPDPDPPHFWQDVERIAVRFRIDPDALAEAVKLGQALLHAHSPAAEGLGDAAGYLLAARDGHSVPDPASGGGGEA